LEVDAMGNDELRWRAQATPLRQMRALAPLLIGTAAACALMLAVLALFSLGESTSAGILFSLKLSALTLGGAWAMVLAGGAIACALRGRLELEYCLSGRTLSMVERGRRTHACDLPLDDVVHARRVRGGLRLRSGSTSALVYCEGDVRESLERALHVRQACPTRMTK
jgi:hypothetical protein